MAIKILIADDEMTVRKRIIKRIEWNLLPLSELKEAEDGVHALEVCRDWSPDLLVTDVRMPRMDGIQLAKELRKKNPDLQIVFISGYADKEYLMSAIELQATNYVEKPLSLPTLFLALKHSCDTVGNKNRQKEEQKELNLLKRQQLAEMLISPSFSAESAKEKYQQAFGEPYTSESLACIAINFFHKDNMDPDTNRRIIESIYLLSDDDTLHLCAVSHYTSLLIFIFSRNAGKSLEYQLTGSICPNLSRMLQLHIPSYEVGVSKIGKSITDAHAAYETAVIAAHQCFFYENGFINYYHSGNSAQYDTHRVNPSELIATLKTASEEHFCFVIRNLISDIRNYDNSLPDVISQYMIDFIFSLKQAAAAESIPLYAEYSSDSDLLEALKRLPFLTDLSSVLLDGVHRFYQQSRAEYYDNPTVNLIIRTIRSDYADPDLSVDSISIRCALSPSYVSHLFKETTGSTLHNYLFDFRMQKALQLVKDPSIRINEIARMVGYRNGNYFSFQFKNKYGQSPTNYRELFL